MHAVEGSLDRGLRDRRCFAFVYLLFVDESGRPDDRTFAVGGVAVRAVEWGLLRDRWLAALDAHAWPHDKEVKWHGTRTGEVPPALADDVFAAVAESPLTCFVVMIKPLAAKQRRPDLFATAEDVDAQPLMSLAERYQRFLARNDAYGAVVVDSRRADVDQRLRRFFERLQRDGTPYVKLERIVDALLFGPSHHSIGLQTADLVVASALAAQRAPGDAFALAQAAAAAVRAPSGHRRAGRRRSRDLPAEGDYGGSVAGEAVHDLKRLGLSVGQAAGATECRFRDASGAGPAHEAEL